MGLKAWNGASWATATSRTGLQPIFTHGEQIQPGLIGCPQGRIGDTRKTQGLSVSGPIDTTANGQVIEGLFILGRIRVLHQDVVVRNCYVKAPDGSQAGYYPIDNQAGNRVLIEDTTVDMGISLSRSLMAGARGVRAIRCHFTGGEDNVFIGGQSGSQSYPALTSPVSPSGLNHVFEDCLMTYLTPTTQDPHGDSVQIISGSDISFRRCKMLAYNFGNPDDPGNAAVILSQNSPLISRVYAGQCHFDGGNYITSWPEEPVVDCTFEGNTYGRQARFGAHSRSGTNSTATGTWASSGDVWRGANYDRAVIAGESIEVMYQ